MSLLKPSKSPELIRFFDTIQLPPTAGIFGSARYEGASSSVIPPVGMNESVGKGALIA
jgi:hypothetical protein